MGIPRFFYWLYKEHPYVMTKIQERDTLLKHKINIDTYALDLNAIVHPICQQVFGYGQYKDGQTNGGIKRLMHSKKEVNSYPSKPDGTPSLGAFSAISTTTYELTNGYLLSIVPIFLPM